MKVILFWLIKKLWAVYILDLDQHRECSRTFFFRLCGLSFAQAKLFKP